MENNKQYVLATDIFNLLLEVRARATRCIGYNHIIHFLAKVLLPIMYSLFSFDSITCFLIFILCRTSYLKHQFFFDTCFVCLAISCSAHYNIDQTFSSVPYLHHALKSHFLFLQQLQCLADYFGNLTGSRKIVLLFSGHSSQYQLGSVLKVLRLFSNFHHWFGSMKDVIPENFSTIGFTNQILWLFKDLGISENLNILRIFDF